MILWSSVKHRAYYFRRAFSIKDLQKAVSAAFLTNSYQFSVYSIALKLPYKFQKTETWKEMKINTQSYRWFWSDNVDHRGSVFHPCIKQITLKLALLLCWWCRAIRICKNSQLETIIISIIETANFKAVLFVPTRFTMLIQNNLPDMCNLLLKNVYKL